MVNKKLEKYLVKRYPKKLKNLDIGSIGFNEISKMNIEDVKKISRDLGVDTKKSYQRMLKQKSRYFD